MNLKYILTIVKYLYTCTSITSFPEKNRIFYIMSASSQHTGYRKINSSSVSKLKISMISIYAYGKVQRR